MATIVNNPSSGETVVQSDSGGWPVTVIVLLIVIAAGVLWYFYHHRPAPTPQPRAEGTTINVSLPGASEPEDTTVGNP